MKISSSINSFNNINSLFNTIAQGQASMFAVKLSNSKVLFPENTAPGKGTIGSDQVSYINDLKTSSGELSGALKALSGSAFNQKGMVSSNSDVMTVSYTGSGNGVEGTKVKIDQIAKGQLNEGAALKSANKYTGNTGVNKFTIETGGKTTQLSVSVSASDTNKDVQQKMATAINNAGLGIKATVDTDSKTGISVLRIESQNTGSDAKNAFTIKDNMGSNAVATTGAANRTSVGQDAIYSVNGGPTQTSKTNTVNLGGGLTATFKAASDEEVTITRGYDSSAATKAVKDMVSSYNSLFGAAAGNVNDPKAQSLASRLMNVSSVYSKSLSDIGIGFDSSGKMTIDSAKLNKAAESGALERFFTENNGKNYGFTNQLSRLADNVKNNTSAYVSNSLFGGDFGYSGFGSLNQMAALRAGSIFDYAF